jgi:hypothetical protein
MVRHLPFAFLLHGFESVKKGKHGIGFWRSGQVQCCSGQWKASFRETNTIKRVRTGQSDLRRLWISQAHILAGKDEHAAEEKAGVFTGVDHFGQPVHRRVRVRAP